MNIVKVENTYIITKTGDIYLAEIWTFDGLKSAEFADIVSATNWIEKMRKESEKE